MLERLALIALTMVIGIPLGMLVLYAIFESVESLGGMP